MKYVVYLWKLEDYRGRYCSHSSLLKFGHSKESATFRLDYNERVEGELAYRKLWGKITILGEKEFSTKQEAEDYEDMVRTLDPRKDCSVAELVKGITELRAYTPQREDLYMRHLK